MKKCRYLSLISVLILSSCNISESINSYLELVKDIFSKNQESESIQESISEKETESVSIKESESEEVYDYTVTLKESYITLEKNKTYQIIATINAKDNIGKGINYYSHNTSIATVSNTGLINAIGVGSTSIRVSSVDDSSKFAYVSVEVVDELVEYDYSTLYDGYYASLSSWSDGEDLKNQLYTIIRNGYTPLKYSANWTSNCNADEALDDLESVSLVYSTNNMLKEKNVGKVTGGWSREHAFAASLMCGESTSDATSKKGRATDFHNLFAASSSGNSSRGNKNLGKAMSSAYGYKEDTDKPGADYKYDSSNFEPSDTDKGKLARAILYMGTMYKDKENDLPGLTIREAYAAYDKNNCSYAIGNCSTLVSWSNTFSVDRSEAKHNESVYKDKVDGYAQGNRNPYIDIPGLVDYVYGSKKNKPGSINYLKPTCIELDTSSTDFNNLAISKAKRIYQVGDTFTKDDYSLIGIKKNFEKEEVEYEDYTLDYTFKESDIGTKTISIDTNYNDIMYEVTVVEGSSKEDGVYKYLDFTKNTTLYKDDTSGVPSTSKYTSQATYKQDDIEFSLYGFNNNSKKWDLVKCGSKSTAYTAYISSSLIDKKINKIVISFGSVNKNAISSTNCSLFVSTSSTYENASKYKFTLSSKNEVTITIPTASQVENGYYKIEFEMPVFADNGYIEIYSISYYGG